VPRAKTFIFEAGLQVPLLVHFPPKWRHLAPAGAGTSDDRLVSLIDLAPTVLSLAGVKIPDQLQGLPLLGSQAGPPRELVHAIKDRMGERLDMSRTVRDSRFKYQRNYLPYLPHYPWHDYMDRMETSKEFRRLAATGQLAGGQAYFMAGHKDLEELYDLAADPHELNNLAKDPRHAADLRRLREEHFAWARNTVDTGFIPSRCCATTRPAPVSMNTPGAGLTSWSAASRPPASWSEGRRQFPN
jgi:N-sulfoglucosamine sulfohydrolase